MLQLYYLSILKIPPPLDPSVSWLYIVSQNESELLSHFFDTCPIKALLVGFTPNYELWALFMVISPLMQLVKWLQYI